MYPLNQIGKIGGGGPFRFLHDEIPGGIFAYSQMKCRSALIGAGSRVGGVDTPFLFNQVSIDYLIANFPAGTVADYYEQINEIAAWKIASASGTSFDGINYIKNFGNAAPSSLIFNLLQSKTIACVFDMTSVDPATTQGIWQVSNSGIVFQQMFYGNAATNPLAIRKQSTSGRQKALFYDNYKVAGQHLVVWVDGGAADLSDSDVYYDDMTAPITPTGSSTTSVVLSADLNQRIGIMNTAQSNTQTISGYLKELHCWNGVLGLTDLATMKEIFQQRYPL